MIRESPLLSVRALEVRYGRLTAVRGVSLDVNAGEMVCIIGANGAGKSSLLAAIAGGVADASGAIDICGKNVSGMRAEDIARLGLSLVPEGRHVFASLTVEENLRLGAFLGKAHGPVDRRLDRIWNLFPVLANRRKFAAGHLSGGEQQMLVIGRALMTSPRIMLVDEPSLGLAPKIIDQVYETLRILRKQDGLTLLVNEQSSKRALKNADRIYVLREGSIQLEGTSSALADGVEIRRAYFGFEDAESRPAEYTT